MRRAVSAYSIPLRAMGLVIALVLLGACSRPEEVPPPTMPPPVEVTNDIVYTRPLQSDVALQKLDVYAPSEPGPWPVVVFVHGYNNKKEGFVELSQAIAEQGAVVFTIDWHTVIPDLAARDEGKGFREMSETLACAIRFARMTASDYGGDPQRVTLVGFSAGAAEGARIALVGDDLDRLWEGFATIRGGPPPQVDCLVNGTSAHVDAFVGVAGPYPYRREIASPYAHLGDNPNLQVRLIHGERDNTAPVRRSVQFHEALVDAGYDTSLTLFDGGHRVPVQLAVEHIMEVARD